MTTQFINTPDPASPLAITPVAGRIGGEVHGIALSADLAPETYDALHAALARHKVLFFRDQHQLDDAGQEAFAARFGDPVSHPTVPVRQGTQHILDLDSTDGRAANSWHTDVTFVPAYPAASILRGVTIPEAGGDTQWANTAAAYDALPEPLRLLADTLWAVHSNAYDYAALRPESSAERIRYQREVFARVVHETEHPVVRIHPVTGERTLLLGHFVQRFVGLGQADSLALFQILQNHILQPENIVRWRWREGDVVIWDNRATQHRATADFGLQRRTVRRVTIAGDVPVSIDGRRSRALRPGADEALLEAAE
ncbi:TauD/TfdA family dioxygenase [Sphingomonas sp.]|jgi:taurine dioxygenase|uniref:TauD/TfdA dioxygenase family protein n=1 Tax=Sphingomonas sp. TaxID=28214 RepID=UPI00260F4C11|nr:TauD/TfdA family dioxygenase [Sphingomonas sp.]MDF2605702.1 TauD/TfdA family dioxygenase [Sphingomonas sp.]